MNRRPQLEIAGVGGQPVCSPAEAAAIVAAVERFMRETARGPESELQQRFPAWQRAALLEGVGLELTAAPTPFHFHK